MASGKPQSGNNPWEGVFAGVTGLWLALALIKFGNPVILNQRVQPPSGLDEWLINPWPVAWGYALLALVILAGCRFWRWRIPVPIGLLVLPLAWLGWQCVAATQTVDRALTAATLLHFVACVGAYWIGVFALARVSRLGPFWLGVVGGFLVVLIMGWRQHFGGLEETRRFFYSLPDWQSYPPEFLKKISSDRIYSTLFYPNTLAGVVLLLAPVSTFVVWQATRNSPPALRLSFAGLVGLLSLGALYWSGSKSGWLVALTQAVVVLFQSGLPPRAKAIILTATLILGLGAFWFKYQDYFGRGATSASARFDYWQAAAKTLWARPLFGSGPGTFQVSYKQIKPPEAEMTRLAHNDYLQQGSDSGWTGMLLYAVWIWGGLAWSYKRGRADSQAFAVWLGLMGLALQSCVEFGLYIPAVAWIFFLLMGWILGLAESRNRIDKPMAGAHSGRAV